MFFLSQEACQSGDGKTRENLMRLVSSLLIELAEKYLHSF